jgi:hypothetical protein
MRAIAVLAGGLTLFGPPRVAQATGCGTASFGAARNFGVGRLPRSVAVADFNGDGKLDLAVANLGSDDLSLLINGCSAPTQTPTAATPMPTPTTTRASPSRTASATPTLSFTPAPMARACVGDCNQDGPVAVDELLTLVSMALGKADISTCRAGDANGDSHITIDEILTAVNNALNGCAAPPVSINLDVTGMDVIKVRTGAQGVTFMTEKLTSLTEFGPERSITLLDNDGAVSGGYSAPSGWALIDFAQHPSGEISAVLATARTVRLVRFDRAAVVRNDFALTDAQAPNDPFYDNGGVRDDGSLLPVLTRDAVRLAAIGENLAVALRTGRNAVVAYRFDYTEATSYTRIWRTLVEPGVTMFGLGITSGSFDVFGALENHWHVHLDADAVGNVAVAVVGRELIAPLFAAHADYFEEPTDVATGLLVTRLATDGQRLGSTVIDTVQTSELHGLRLNGDDISLVGRVFSERRDDGTGWNAYAAHVDRATGALLGYGVIDLDRGEVLFDIVRLARGRFLVAGAAGYSQNPTGGSISEQTTPLLAVLESDGTLGQRIDVVAGARQNQLRSLAPRNGNWLVGGMVNGPGTHSGDGNPAAIVADGFVHETTISVP